MAIVVTERYAVANANSGAIIKDDLPDIIEAGWYARRLAITYGLAYIAYPYTPTQERATHA